MYKRRVLITNDLAEIDNMGRFKILGRTDNTIDSGGIKIQTEDVEKALERYLKIPFAITSCRSLKFGEAIVLLYVKENIPEDEIKQLCNKVLPEYWRPKAYMAVDMLPMTETGKPDRAAAKKTAEKFFGGHLA